MKLNIITYLLLMLSVVCFGDNADRHKELNSLIKEGVQKFKEIPTQEGFDKLIPLCEEMIEMDPSKVSGYLFLSEIYMNAGGGVLDKKEALRKTVTIVDQYQSKKNRTIDLSSLKENILFQIEALEEKEKLDRDTQRMLDSMNPPPVIASAKELIRQYYEQKNTDSVDVSLLDQALVILNDELKKKGADLDVYLTISRIHYIKGAYANAYAMWQLAYEFADDKEDFALANSTAQLYMVAVNYENQPNGISENPPGDNPIKYFIWLNRETIAEKIPRKIKSDMDTLMEEMEENK